MKKVLWSVGLSNGETFVEGKGNFAVIEGALSPWQRLLSYIAEKELVITSLSLITDYGQRWNMPSAGKNPRFRMLGNAKKPIMFRSFVAAASSIREGFKPEEELYIVAEAIFEDGLKMQTWVDNETLASWSIIL